MINTTVGPFFIPVQALFILKIASCLIQRRNSRGLSNATVNNHRVQRINCIVIFGLNITVGIVVANC